MKVSEFIRNNKLVKRTRNEKGQFVRGDFERLNIYALVTQLIEKAGDILDNLGNYIGYQSRLGNLIDSTAAAVYVDGELVEDSIVYATNPPESTKAAPRKKQAYAFNAGMTGREAIDAWFEENTTLSSGKRKNTVQLVIVAAMYYGYFLETGGYGGPEIEVISGLADEMESQIGTLASEAGYKPSLTGITGYSSII